MSNSSSVENIIAELIKLKPHQNNILLELQQRIPQAHVVELCQCFGREDGAAKFCELLPKYFPSETVITPAPGGEIKPNPQRAWELIGWYYKLEQRYHDALSLYTALYYHMLSAQEKASSRIHKGMPLVYIADCYAQLGCVAYAKRYLMLTLCEDAIYHKGAIPANETGIYFRLVWGGGLTDADFRRYATEIYELSKNDAKESYFPEFVLQKLDQSWMTEFPTSKEASMYVANHRYINSMLSKLVTSV